MALRKDDYRLIFTVAFTVAHASGIDIRTKEAFEAILTDVTRLTAYPGDRIDLWDIAYDTNIELQEILEMPPWEP